MKLKTVTFLSTTFLAFSTLDPNFCVAIGGSSQIHPAQDDPAGILLPSSPVRLPLGPDPIPRVGKKAGMNANDGNAQRSAMKDKMNQQIARLDDSGTYDLPPETQSSFLKKLFRNTFFRKKPSTLPELGPSATIREMPRGTKHRPLVQIFNEGAEFGEAPILGEQPIYDVAHEKSLPKQSFISTLTHKIYNFFKGITSRIAHLTRKVFGRKSFVAR